MHENQRIINTFLVGLAIAMLVSACGEDRKLSSRPPAPNGKTPKTNPNPQPKTAGSDEFTGDWNSACVDSDGSVDGAQSMIVVWTFSSGSQLSAKKMYFSDLNCNVSGFVKNLVVSGTYRLGDYTDEDTRQIDYTLDGYTTYEVVRNDGQYLYFGQVASNSDATSPETRPTTLWESPSFGRM